LDKLGRWGCRWPWLANELSSSFFFRHFLEWGLDISSRRPLPRFSATRFDHWFAKRQHLRSPTRGPVILWDDTFVRYYEPHIGMAAVKLLEAAGYEVILPTGRECCGRPAFSQGNLGKAMRLGRHNLRLLSADGGNAPILFLEPSCHSMVVEDYREL
jgi:Fe-S oxidoreductase